MEQCHKRLWFRFHESNILVHRTLILNSSLKLFFICWRFNIPQILSFKFENLDSLCAKQRQSIQCIFQQNSKSVTCGSFCNVTQSWETPTFSASWRIWRKGILLIRQCWKEANAKDATCDRREISRTLKLSKNQICLKQYNFFMRLILQYFISEILQYIISKNPSVHTVKIPSDSSCGDLTWMPTFLRSRRDVVYTGYDLLPVNIHNAKLRYTVHGKNADLVYKNENYTCPAELAIWNMLQLLCNIGDDCAKLFSVYTFKGVFQCLEVQ